MDKIMDMEEDKECKELDESLQERAERMAAAEWKRMKREEEEGRDGCEHLFLTQMGAGPSLYVCDECSLVAKLAWTEQNDEETESL